MFTRYENNISWKSEAIESECRDFSAQNDQPTIARILPRSLITTHERAWKAIIKYVCFFLLQYYEMSYGLNVEMHKQVSENFVETISFGALSFIFT